MNEILITPEMWENGFNGLYKISKTSQNYLRHNKKITYTKILRKIYYKREWIEDYINNNIRPAKTLQENE